QCQGCARQCRLGQLWTRRGAGGGGPEPGEGGAYDLRVVERPAVDRGNAERGAPCDRTVVVHGERRVRVRWWMGNPFGQDRVHRPLGAGSGPPPGVRGKAQWWQLRRVRKMLPPHGRPAYRRHAPVVPALPAALRRGAGTIADRPERRLSVLA